MENVVSLNSLVALVSSQAAQLAQMQNEARAFQEELHAVKEELLAQRYSKPNSFLAMASGIVSWVCVCTKVVQ